MPLTPILSFALLFLLLLPARAQEEGIPILLRNASFEGTPAEGGRNARFILDGWTDCGSLGQTPPDVHPVRNGGQFGVTQKPADGNTFLGLVVRQDSTWESVAQRLESPLRKDVCYEFSIRLCRSDHYRSASVADTSLEVEYTTPAKFRIWGGSGICNRQELLAESALVTSYRWLEYNFRLEPSQNYTYIVLEAYYNSLTPFFYNGNLLLDNASAIIPVPCIVETPTIADETPPEPSPSPKPKILRELDRTKITEGQTIRMDQLYFAADSAAISSESFPVLDELFDFLAAHPDVTVEIGGHTNDIPSHEYCDRLSNERAKAVVEYLTAKGIDPDRLQHKGYGKRNPVDTNRTTAGRKKNQRVEIKILSVNG
ncbi:MAG: hypothetical protein RLY31_2278 [Bacteroidota bacterium]|jgi:outer membrane protein OmpA-like peptidoglycan-associated protein